jgi:NAD+ synthase (glutamine-hydrolysing)
VTLRVAIAQLNFVVGDIAGNAARIISAAAEARAKHAADVIAFPELAVTGYPPEDLLMRPGFQRRVDETLIRIREQCAAVAVAVGHPHRAGADLYNACSWFEGGETRAVYYKQDLPNYAVFDEKRYFKPGNSALVVEKNGVRVALTVCEDIWNRAIAPQARAAGAELILNINGSPYHVGKRALRLETLRRATREGGLPIIYGNLVGGQDELIFDGGSMVVDMHGEVVASASEFEEELFVVSVERDGDALRFSGPKREPLGELVGIYRALVLGIRDYVTKNGFNGAVVGLSGGVDSALTLALAVDALGAAEIHAISMPSRYTADMSVEDARAQAATLGCSFDVIPIEQPVAAFATCLAPVFGRTEPDATEENIQARCRGVILMAISNKKGRIVLTTGNKSEMSVGYATLYGDMAGGFAPLKDVPKTLVYRLADYRNSLSPVIPRRVIERAPSAELRPDQKDTDTLPPYDVLDPILELYIEQDRTPREICALGFDRETVYGVARMVDRNEYKRRQAAPGIKISRRAFGRDRRYPITSKYAETDRK